MANKYDKKKKDLASKGMPNPKVGKNVTSGDRKAEMGKKPRLHWGTKNFTASNPSYHKPK